MIPFLWISERGITNGWGKKSAVVWGQWWTGKRNNKYFWNDRKVLCIDIVVYYAGINNCQNSLDSKLKMYAFHCIYL